jgi:hypothetical protein
MVPWSVRPISTSRSARLPIRSMRRRADGCVRESRAATSPGRFFLVFARLLLNAERVDSRVPRTQIDNAVGNGNTAIVTPAINGVTT